MRLLPSLSSPVRRSSRLTPARSPSSSSLTSRASASSPRSISTASRRCARPSESQSPRQAALSRGLLERLGPAIAKSYNTAGPGYLAYIPGGGVYASALADFIATATNRYVGVTAAAPALAQIEETAVALAVRR